LDQKAIKIREVKARGLRVAMTGNGVNDAPGLTEADVAIAIGAGTDVAIESADIVLVRSDPRNVAAIVLLARATYRKMVQTSGGPPATTSSRSRGGGRPG
jgi:P-type Cu2+ transporter